MSLIIATEFSEGWFALFIQISWLIAAVTKSYHEIEKSSELVDFLSEWMKYWSPRSVQIFKTEKAESNIFRSSPSLEENIFAQSYQSLWS